MLGSISLVLALLIFKKRKQNAKGYSERVDQAYKARHDRVSTNYYCGIGR